MNRWSSAETSNQSTHIREHGGSLAENSAPPAHDFPVVVTECVAATKRSLEATMMKSDPKFMRYAACRHSIAMVQMAVAVLLLADPVGAQAAQSCAEPVAAATSNMSDNACKLKIGTVGLNEFPVWKAVDPGAYHDANAVRDGFRKTPAFIHIDSWADQMLKNAFLEKRGPKITPLSGRSA